MMHYKYMSARALASLFILSLLLQVAFARKPNTRVEADSLRKANQQRRHAEADSIRQLVTPEVFSPEHADSLLRQIDRLHSALNTITNESRYGFKTEQIEKELAHMQSAIDVISLNLGRDSAVMNIGNLQMYRRLLANMADKLSSWREVLYQDNKELLDMTGEMQVFVKDSFALHIAADTAFAKLHLEELLILKEKWHEAKSATKANLARIGKLQTGVSTAYFDVTEMENKVGNQLAGTGARTFGKEYNFIWHTQNPSSLREVMVFTYESIAERISILRYYLSINTATWLTPVVLAILFFIWVFFNSRKVKAATQKVEGTSFTFKYLHSVPVYSALVVLLGGATFYGLNQPGEYVQILLFLTWIPVAVLVWRNWPRSLFFYWCLFGAFYALTYVSNSVITPGWPLRFFLLGLNLVSALAAWRFLSDYNQTLPVGKAVRPVAVWYIFMNLLAAIANCAGRLTLAKILSAAAIGGLVQIIALLVLLHLLIEAFYLQMKSRRIAAGRSAEFDYSDIENNLYGLLLMVAAFCWLVTLATNLQLYPAITSFLDILLNTKRDIGSATFALGNIVSFILILFGVNVLQKYLGYFLGETEDDLAGDLDKKESRLVLFRIIIITAGFFLAVVASGLPVDKVTVVLGALSVGIGLGLQNIVYNLISGLILIFEKPMQIGDYIEVADKKGRVQSIGIRSSRLLVADGSEVTVPNGDILSSHMVNWTRGNTNLRTQLSIKIEPATALQTAKDTILAELKKNPLVMEQRPVEILLNNLSETAVEMSIHVWIKSIYKEEEFKSELLSLLYARLAEKGIKMV